MTRGSNPVRLDVDLLIGQVMLKDAHLTEHGVLASHRAARGSILLSVKNFQTNFGSLSTGLHLLVESGQREREINNLIAD